MSIVEIDSTIKVHYTGKLENGEVFDSSEGRQPLQFKVGAGMMIQGFDEGVLGMKLNETKTIKIPFEKGYGAVRPELIRDVERKFLPEGLEPKLGMKLEGKYESGQSFKVTITEIKDESVTIDANHELAGKNLVFDVKVVEISNLDLA
ncbi:MAG: peptidylprolyl isomerase [Flavobacteriales bacterium]|nr:peptidylprolyl isomerase [Flavobacteriales bacterium]